jgi:hypothetical protein
LSGGSYQWEGEYKERVMEGEYGWNIMYACINGKMRPVETILRMGQGREKKMMEGWIQLWYIIRTFVNVTTYP